MGIRAGFPILVALAVVTGDAQALTISATSGVLRTVGGVEQGRISPQAGVTTETMDACGATTGFDGDFLVGAGTVFHRRLAPDQNAGCYLSVGNNRIVSSSRFTLPTAPFGQRIDYIGFYVGSPDPYNFISFLDGNGTPINLGSYGVELDGTEMTTLPGGPSSVPLPTPVASTYLEFFFAAADTQPVRIQFRSENYALEVDNISWRFVPLSQNIVANSLVDAETLNVVATPAPGSYYSFVAMLAIGKLVVRRRSINRAFNIGNG
ncbi:MAG: hypothetical protein RQ833_05210 [Sphingomonadaceae bacterium]|nr:hypothetical protein [Sphingomonadaceae bacterium]